MLVIQEKKGELDRVSAVLRYSERRFSQQGQDFEADFVANT